MPVTVPEPLRSTRYVDKDGKLTTEGIILLLKVVEKLEDHENRLVGGGL